MRLPSDTQTVKFAAAGPAEPVLDFHAKLPRPDGSGQPDVDLTKRLLARPRTVATMESLVSSEEPFQHDANGLSLLGVQDGRGFKNQSQRLVRCHTILLAKDQGVGAHLESDLWEVRESKVRSDITVIMAIFQNEATAKVFPRIVDIFVKMVVGEKSDPA